MCFLSLFPYPSSSVIHVDIFSVCPAEMDQWYFNVSPFSMSPLQIPETLRCPLINETFLFKLDILFLYKQNKNEFYHL